MTKFDVAAARQSAEASLAEAARLIQPEKCMVHDARRLLAACDRIEELQSMVSPLTHDAWIAEKARIKRIKDERDALAAENEKLRQERAANGIRLCARIDELVAKNAKLRAVVEAAKECLRCIPPSERMIADDDLADALATLEADV